MIPLQGPTARQAGELPPWLWALPSLVEVLRALILLCHEAGNESHRQGWGCADVEFLRGCTRRGRLWMQKNPTAASLDVIPR